MTGAHRRSTRMILFTRRRSDGGDEVLYELSGDEAGGGRVTEGDARCSSLDLSLVFSEGGPRSKRREKCLIEKWLFV